MQTMTRPRSERRRAIMCAPVKLRGPIPGGDELRCMEAWLRAGATIDEALERATWGVMPISGGGADTAMIMLQNVPVSQYSIDPRTFYTLTERNIFQFASFAFSAGTNWTPVALPAVGVIGKVVLELNATITQTTAAATTTALWPYGILQSSSITANGQDDLLSARGVAYKALERTRRPYGNNFPGELVGPGIGGGLTLATGTTRIRLHWELPLAFDEASCIGGIFAQSRALNNLLKGSDAAIAAILTNTTGTTAISGTWTAMIETFQVPQSKEGVIIIPDLTYLHSFNEQTFQLPGTGDNKVALQRTSGVLQRVFVQVETVGTNPVTLLDASAVNPTQADNFRLEFGGNKRPYQWNPAATLLDQNGKDYGGDARVGTTQNPTFPPLPFNFVCQDFARWNPIRDAINLAGVTELFWVTAVTSGTTITSGLHFVSSETLFR